MREKGSITLWMVGLVMVVMAVGGIGIDLWRGLAAHRLVASTVDAAAVAAGSAIDEEFWRSDGSLRLDAERVEARSAEAVAAQSGAVPLDYSVEVAADGSEATVTASTVVELTLLALLVDDDLEVAATASVVPVLSP